MDKVQKIIKKIHDEMDGLMDANGNFAYREDEGAYHALCDLEAYIDFLTKESVSEELEEEIDKYTDNPANYLEYSDGWSDLTDIEYIEKAAHHFADWQKKQTINKACEWLDKTIRFYLIHEEMSFDDFIKKLKQYMED